MAKLSVLRIALLRVESTFDFMNMGVVLCLPIMKFVLLSLSFKDPSNFKVTVQSVFLTELDLLSFL